MVISSYEYVKQKRKKNYQNVDSLGEVHTFCDLFKFQINFQII